MFSVHFKLPWDFVHQRENVFYPGVKDLNSFGVIVQEWLFLWVINVFSYTMYNTFYYVFSINLKVCF